MHIEIRSKAFVPWTEMQHNQDALHDKGKYGAIASFIETMRDFNEGKHVHAMTLKHYPGITESDSSGSVSIDWVNVSFGSF